MTEDDSPVPVFTGAELALADALILIMKVLAMRGVIDAEAIDTVFSEIDTLPATAHRSDATRPARRGR